MTMMMMTGREDALTQRQRGNEWGPTSLPDSTIKCDALAGQWVGRLGLSVSGQGDRNTERAFPSTSLRVFLFGQVQWSIKKHLPTQTFVQEL